MPSLSSVGVATLVILAAAGPFLQFGYAGGVLDCTEPTECGSTPPPVRLASSAPSVWRAAVCAFLASPVKRGSFSVGPLDGSPSLTIDAQLPLHHDDPVYAAAPFVCLLLALLVADFLTVSAKYLWVVSKRSCPQRSALNIASFKRFVGYIVAAPGNASMEGSSGGEGTGVRDDGVPEPLHRASGVRRRAPGQSEGGSQLAGAESGRAEDEAEGNCQILVRELRALRAENAAGGRGGASDFVAQAKLQRRIIRLEQQLEKTARDRTARGDLGDHEHTGDVYDMMDSVFGSGRRQRSFLIGLEGAVGQAVNRTVAAVASSLFKGAFCYTVVCVANRQLHRSDKHEGWALLLPARFFWPFIQYQQGSSQWCGFGFPIAFLLGRLAVDVLYGRFSYVGRLLSQACARLIRREG